ncbi:MAG: catalase family protein [Acidobacteriaceae bacterium]|nr:catalase family protein [Acidobacteriaceae bacterium]
MDMNLDTETLRGETVKMQPKTQEIFVRYSEGVETVPDGEAATSDEIVATLLEIAKKVGERQRHTVRAVHAKSNGLVKVEVTVLPALREELSQGLFAKPASYSALMRFSSEPGDILSDHTSTPRGLALKIIGVEGEMLPNHRGQLTQDFIFNNGSTFAANADAFLKAIQFRAKHLDDPDELKQAVSSVAQAAEETLELVGRKSAFLKGIGHPQTHPLGETYYTAVPLRFGDYFGKMQLVPVSDNLTALRGKHVDHPHRWNTLKDSIVAFFQKESAIWELRVQLCTDLRKMPVEDASVEWDEHLSPALTVARVTGQPQNVYSDARRVWVDEQLSFNPWHGLAAHRPLGSIMRARLKAYQASSQFRHAAEGRRIVEPLSIEELPD